MVDLRNTTIVTIIMKLPKQSKPITRQVLHDPHLTVDLKLLEDSIVTLEQQFQSNPNNEKLKRDLKEARDALLNLKFELLHSINHNDPKFFIGPADFCGCQILSGQARRICIVGCGWF